MQSDDPLSAVFAAVEARVSAPLSRPLSRAALDAYFRAPEEFELAARGAMAAVVPHALRASAAIRAAAHDDPAAPGLAQEYGAALAELSELATVFVALGPDAEEDDFAAEYRAVCAEISELVRAAEQAQPVWDLVRRSQLAYAASRARPPPRAPPRRPLADDAEYYA